MEKVIREKYEGRIQQEIFMHFWNTYPHLRRTLFSVPNEGERDYKMANRLKAQGLVKGIPDMIWILPDGRAVGIEVKAPGGKQSPDQVKVETAWTDLGIPYHLVYCLDDFLNLVRYYEVK